LYNQPASDKPLSNVLVNSTNSRKICGESGIILIRAFIATASMFNKVFDIREGIAKDNGC
jgi:hypothetical protein